MNAVRTIEFDGELVGAEVLEVTNDGRYFAVQAYSLIDCAMHYFVCEQFSRFEHLTVIYFAGNNAIDADDVWQIYMDSGYGLSEEEVAVGLFLDLLISNL